MKMFKFGPLTFLWNASPLTIASLQLNRAFNRATEAAARLNGPLSELPPLEIDPARDVAPRLVDTCEAKKNGWPNYIGWACRPCSTEWPFPSSSKPDCVRRSLPRDKGPRPYHWRDNQNERRADLDWPGESRPWALNVPDPAAAMRVEGEVTITFPDRPIIPTEVLIFDHPPCEHLAPLMTGMADHIASFCKKRRVDGPTPCDWPCCSCASDALAARAAGEPLRYTVPAEADLPPDIVAANRAATASRPCHGAGKPSPVLPYGEGRCNVPCRDGDADSRVPSEPWTTIRTAREIEQERLAAKRAGPPTPRAGKPFDVC